uniref:AH domain-containing protein n=1 Tax=Panagrellus redivivus TaxID=6233 RepID=A0A7E4VPE2_PANRE
MDLFDKLEGDLLVELRALKALRKTAFEAALKTANSNVDLGCTEGQLFEMAVTKSVKAEVDMIKAMRVSISGYKDALDGLIGASKKVDEGLSDGRMSLIPRPRVKFSENNENEPPSFAMRPSLSVNFAASLTSSAQRWSLASHFAGSSQWTETPKAVKSALKKPKTPTFAPSAALREEPEEEDLDQTPTASSEPAPQPVKPQFKVTMPVLSMPISPVLHNKKPPIIPSYSNISSVTKRPITPPTLSRPSIRTCYNNTLTNWTPKPLNFEDSLI